MLYSQFYFKDKAKIPIPLAAVLLFVVSLLMGSVFIKTGPGQLRASKVSAKRVEVTNLSPVQATLFWQSETQEEGFVFYGASLNQINTMGLDDRDVASKKNKYLNHYATLRNLEPGRIYFFKIVSNNQLIVRPDGTPFSFKTPVLPAAASTLSPAHGSVLKENLSGEENALVMLTVDNFYPMSTLTKGSGEWLVPLNSFFDKERLENKILSSETPVKIEIFGEDNKNSVITGRLNQLSPVAQTIIIGRNYDLSTESNVLSAETSSSVNPSASKIIDIIYPVDAAVIPGRSPLIKGVALPKSQVFITVRSAKTFSATLTADNKGNWSYQLPESLELGAHTITIKTKDSQGKETTITRNFTIVANDNAGRVLGEATGSASLTATPTLTPTTIPMTTTLTPTSVPTIPVTGVTDFIPIIGGLSFILAGLGVLLVF